MRDRSPLDVWLKFESPEDEEATCEANTFQYENGFSVEWYHNAVGQVSSKTFSSYEEARQWLYSEGFQDFTS